jgi:hypothetical protein
VHLHLHWSCGGIRIVHHHRTRHHGILLIYIVSVFCSMPNLLHFMSLLLTHCLGIHSAGVNLIIDLVIEHIILLTALVHVFSLCFGLALDLAFLFVFGLIFYEGLCFSKHVSF